jgi:hypothetical protein
MVGRAATILAGAMAKEVLVAHGDLGLYLASLRCKVIVEEGLWQTTSKRARLRGGDAFGWPAYTRRRGEIMKRAGGAYESPIDGDRFARVVEKGQRLLRRGIAPARRGIVVVHRRR